MENLYNMCRTFSSESESASEGILEIGLHLPKLWWKVKCFLR